MKYFFAVFFILATLGTALADSRDSTIANVPFDFVIGNKAFPAGTYSISQISDDPYGGLHIQSSDGKINAFFHSAVSDNSENDQAKLIFLHQGNMYFLTKIFSRTDTYTLAPAHQRQKTVEPAEVVTVGP